MSAGLKPNKTCVLFLLFLCDRVGRRCACCRIVTRNEQDREPETLSIRKPVNKMRHWKHGKDKYIASQIGSVKLA